MDKKMLTELRSFYTAPVPLRKEAFLKTLRSKKAANGRLYTGNRTIILAQLRYIRKRVWVSSVLILLLALTFMEKGTVLPQICSVFAGLLIASVAMYEARRSAVYQMEELETATRFSLRFILMTRFCGIGFFHLLLLLPGAVFAGTFTGRSVWVEYLCLLVPYLLSAYLGMLYARYIRSDRYGLGYLAITLLLGLLTLFSGRITAALCRADRTGAWAAAAVVLLMLTAAEGRKMLGKELVSEGELSWN